jgi:hypothetical protein
MVRHHRQGRSCGRHRIVALALTLVCLAPASAWGVTVREYQLQYSPAEDPSGAFLIVTALVDPQESLPASVSVPVPSGGTILWAGELLGGDPSADPSRETTVERVGEMDVYTLTLEQVYTAQIEIKLAPAVVDGSRVRSSVTWTNPGAETLVTAAVIAEPGATGVKTTPDVSGEIRTNDDGQSLYPLTASRVPQDGSYTISAEWMRSGQGGGGSNPTLPIIIGLLVVTVVALITVLVRERTRARRAAASDL